MSKKLPAAKRYRRRRSRGDHSGSGNWEPPAEERYAPGRQYNDLGVTCHKDGTVSYHSVTQIARLSHVREVLPGDEAFLRPEELARAKAHLRANSPKEPTHDA